MTRPPSERVVITGMGQISPLGNRLDALWQALTAGTSGVGPLASLPAEPLPVGFAGEAREFTGHIDQFGTLDGTRQKAIRKGLKMMCRETQMGVASAQLALDSAGLAPGGYDPDRVGVVFGSDYMLTMPEEFAAGIARCRDDQGRFEFSRWGTDGLDQMQPLWLLKYLPNMPASHIAIYNDLRGPSNSLTEREASANLAIGEAYHIVRRGHADVIVAGATGTRVHPLRTVHVMLQEQLATGNGDPARASRPFDAQRTGMVLGEGAGAVVLERLDRALARGATIYAEILGQASSAVASRNLVGRLDEALANALRRALSAADLAPEKLGHIHAHGLSTVVCDAQEAQAIRRVCGDAADHIPVTAAKSYFGNLGAGGGAVELIASVLAIKHERLFKLLNYQTPDPECPILAATSEMPAGSSFVNLNVTPQGQAAAIAVGAYHG